MEEKRKGILPADTNEQDNTRIQWEEERSLGLTGDMILERQLDEKNLGNALGNPATGWWSNAWINKKKKSEGPV